MSILSRYLTDCSCSGQTEETRMKYYRLIQQGKFSHMGCGINWDESSVPHSSHVRCPVECNLFICYCEYL